MMTPLEKIQRRAARLAGELDRCEAAELRAVDTILKAAAKAMQLRRQLRSLRRRTELATEKMRELARPPRRPRSRPGPEPEMPAPSAGHQPD